MTFEYRLLEDGTGIRFYVAALPDADPSERRTWPTPFLRTVAALREGPQ
jgi:hypothetical protein